MATEHVKVYEEKKGLPIWAWLLPLLLLLALLAYFLLHRNHPTDAVAPAGAATATAASAGGPATAAPNLGSVHFDTDKATLTPEGQATLTRAAEYMKQNPGAHLRVEGFTDATGNDPHNQDLSVQRAMTAANFLQSQGIERSRLTGGGFASNNPVDTNATEAGKADNRRVELFHSKFGKSLGG